MDQVPVLRELVSRTGNYGIEYALNLDSSVPVAGDPQDAEYKFVILRQSPAASRPLDKSSLSMFLEDGTGICEPTETIFMNNSEIHLVCRPVPELFDRTSVAHYNIPNHVLGLRTMLDPSKAFFDGGGVFPDGSFLVVISVALNQRFLAPAIEKYEFPANEGHKIQELHLEIGRAVASLVYSAAELGWEVRLLGPQLGFEALKRLTGLKRDVDLANETPVVALLVFPSSAMSGGAQISASRIRSRILECFDDNLNWEGSPDRVRLGQPDTARKSATKATEMIDGEEIMIILDGNAVRPGLSSPYFHYPPGASTMRQVLRSRTSHAVDLDGSYVMNAQQFRQFLLRCCWDKEGDCNTPPCFPHSALPWKPRVHVFFIIKMVQGLVPGTYCLVRNKLHHPSLIESTTPADDEVPSFYRICQHVLDARNMAFGVAMVGTANGVDAADHESIYPRVLWEAGFIGELLTVEAAAQGISAVMTTSLDFWKYRFSLGFKVEEEMALLAYYAVGKRPNQQLQLPSTMQQQ